MLTTYLSWRKQTKRKARQRMQNNNIHIRIRYKCYLYKIVDECEIRTFDTRWFSLKYDFDTLRRTMTFDRFFSKLYLLFLFDVVHNLVTCESY